MLNTNLNIIPLLSQKKNDFDYRPLFYWSYESKTVASDNSNIAASASGSFTITGPVSNAILISTNQNGTFIGSEREPYTASISGSGQWPITGSTTMSLFVFGVQSNEFTQTYTSVQSVSGSQALGTLAAASGSILSNAFTGSLTQTYYVTGSIIHTKGNIFNPKVNWIGKTPYTGDVVPIMDITSSLIIVKDTNVGLVNTSFVTESKSGSFQYEYAMSVTASVSSSYSYLYDTGSFPSLLNLKTTMSLQIPEINTSISSSATSSLLTASFFATTNTPYTITASIAGTYVIPAVSASIVVVGAGGGGAAGGGGGGVTLFGAGGAGGAGGVYKFDTLIQPFSKYTVNTVGTFGSGGLNITSGSPAIATSASLGQNGGLTSLTYFTSNKTTSTLIASGGFGAGQEYPSSPIQSMYGGSSGNGFQGGQVPANAKTNYYGGGAGGGTEQIGQSSGTGPIPPSPPIPTPASGSAIAFGGNYLGGMGGTAHYTMTTGQNPDLPNLAQRAPTFNLPSPYDNITFTWTGSAGWTSTNESLPTGSNATAFGGGGAGAGDSWVTSGKGGDGANGVVIVAYYGSPVMTVTKGWTTYDSASNYTQHYITGSGGQFWYEYTGDPILV
jgi:hypothetical protein